MPGFELALPYGEIKIPLKKALVVNRFYRPVASAPSGRPGRCWRPEPASLGCQM